MNAANDDRFESPWTWRDYAAMAASYGCVLLIAWLMVWPA